MRTTVLEALKPLGPDYVKELGTATAAKWMDPLPREGKRSGAYMNPGAFDVHPYLLLNLKEDYSGMTTYAHEWGHAMRSEEHTSELQSLMRISYAVFCLKKKKKINTINTTYT